MRSSSAYKVGTSPGIRIKLNQNENPFGISSPVQEKLGEIFAKIDVNRYPSEQPNELVEAIASYAGVESDSVLVTHGSNEFVHSLCIAFIEQGRTALVPSPSFSFFRSSVLLFGGELIEIDADENFDFPIDEICEASRRLNPELVIIAAPNNPTGRDLSIDDIERIVQANAGMVVVDEAYWEFTDRPSASSLLDRYENMIVMRTLSKAFGLAGLRIGYAIARPAVIAELLKVRLPFMVSRFDAAIAIEVLRQPEEIRETARKLKSAQQELARQMSLLPNVNVIPSETNFVLFKTPFKSADLLERLAEHGILVRDMSGYPRLDGFLRVNAGTDAENTAFMAALNSIVL